MSDTGSLGATLNIFPQGALLSHCRATHFNSFSSPTLVPQKMDSKAGDSRQEAGTDGKETKALTNSQEVKALVTSKEANAVADSQKMVTDVELSASQLEGGWNCVRCGGALRSQTQVHFRIVRHCSITLHR